MLTLEKTIADTHDDYSPWADVIAGFSDDRELVIRYSYTDYDDRDNDYRLSASLDFDSSLKVARRLGVSITGLPEELARKFGSSTDMATASEVKDIFEEVIDFLSGSGAGPRIRKERPGME